MNRLVAGAALAALLAAPAAADSVKAPLYAPRALAANWTGFYVGAHIGAGWGTVEAEIPLSGILGVPVTVPFASHSVNGMLGGVQGGFNWQFGWMLLGIEADWSWSGMRGTAPCLVVLSCTTKVSWLGTVGGRLGFAVDQALIYLKLGGGFAEFKRDVNLLGLATVAELQHTRFGLMLGTGIEYALGPNWSAKVEYNFLDFGKKTFDVTVTGLAATVPVAIRDYEHLVKFGVNYRFALGL